MTYLSPHKLGIGLDSLVLSLNFSTNIKPPKDILNSLRKSPRPKFGNFKKNLAWGLGCCGRRCLMKDITTEETMQVCDSHTCTHTQIDRETQMETETERDIDTVHNGIKLCSL